MFIMKTSIFACFLFIFLSILNASAQDKDSLDIIIQRLEILESYKENLDGLLKMRWETLNQNFAIKSKALDLRVEQIQTGLKNDYSYIKKIAFFFGSVTILSIIIGIIRLNKKVYKIAEVKIKEKFDKLFEDEKDKLIDLMEKHDEENQLRQTKSILVLSPEGSSDTFLRLFFGEMGFLKVNYSETKEDIIYGNFDLILFNDEEQRFDKNFLKKIVSEIPQNTLCFYFGPERIHVPELSVNKFAFANSRVQLYGNVINALRYQKLLN